MSQEIDSCVQEFESYYNGDHGRCLSKHLYRRNNEACALGAFFTAHSAIEARNHNDRNQAAPGWLVKLTPNLFDNIKEAFDWGRSIYGADGALQRAGRMPVKERKELFSRVREEALARINCKEHPYQRNFVNLADAVYSEIDTAGIAWTITRVFHEELEKLGY